MLTNMLAKRIMYEGYIAPKLYSEEQKRFLLQQLKLAIKIDAENLVDSFYQSKGNPSDNLFIPFKKCFWIEWLSEGSDRIIGRFGALILVDKSIDHKAYYLRAHEFVGIPRQPILGPILDCLLVISNEGKLIDNPRYSDLIKDFGLVFEYPDIDRRGPSQEFIQFILHVLRFLSCKNVKLEDHSFEEKDQRRLIKRHGGKPENYKFHTLMVTNNYSGKTGPSEKTDFKMPLHMVRGHVSHYTSEKPLFGKYPGTFYIPSHARGDKQYGVVEKDYKLKEKP